MLDPDRVFSLFLLFSDLSVQDGERYRCLCENAAAALTGRLRPEADTAAGMERLCAAAAACATGDYLTLNAALPGGEVRVGDISLRAAQASADAEEIRRHFLEQVADLLDAPFVFGQVPS